MRKDDGNCVPKEVHVLGCRSANEDDVGIASEPIDEVLRCREGRWSGDYIDAAAMVLF